MILTLKQVKKDLYAADFVILRGDMQVGTMRLQGSMGQEHGNVFIEYNGHSYTMRRMPRKSSLKEIFTTAGPFKPCEIIEDGHKIAHLYYDQCIKINRWASSTVCKLFYGGSEYWMYFVGRGYEKPHDPIYKDNEQIALIEIDNVIYDGMRVYTLYGITDEDAFLALLYACYIYRCAGYEAGQKVIKGVSKSYTRTKHQIILDKLTPNFCENITP